jgi:hypothetical protein
MFLTSPLLGPFRWRATPDYYVAIGQLATGLAIEQNASVLRSIEVSIRQILPIHPIASGTAIANAFETLQVSDLTDSLAIVFAADEGSETPAAPRWSSFVERLSKMTGIPGDRFARFQEGSESVRFKNGVELFARQSPDKQLSQCEEAYTYLEAWRARAKAFQVLASDCLNRLRRPNMDFGSVADERRAAIERLNSLVRPPG